jgi:hypothetical protein
MTCRHDRHDPHCSSNANAYAVSAQMEKELEEYKKAFRLATTPPDNTRYEILDVVDINDHLVMKVRYESCGSCAGEAEKIMVFKASLLQAMKWRTIDPHFQIPRNAEVLRPITNAPPPLARFMPDEQGWQEAIEYAKRVGRTMR